MAIETTDVVAGGALALLLAAFGALSALLDRLLPVPEPAPAFADCPIADHRVGRNDYRDSGTFALKGGLWWDA